MNETTNTTVTSGNIGLGTLCLLTSIALIILHVCGVLSCPLWFCFLPIIFGGRISFGNLRDCSARVAYNSDYRLHRRKVRGYTPLIFFKKKNI